MKIALGLVLALVACSDHSRSEKTEVAAESPRKPREIDPPAGVVRALPPHAIRNASIGPYKLGQKLSEILEELPSGPRVVLFEVPNVLHTSLIRADDNAVLIGGEPQGTATFVAVVGPEVARTESGIHVGSTREELVQALGAPVDELDHARDPRLVIPSGMRNARIVLDDDRSRISAIAIVGELGTLAGGSGGSGSASPAPTPSPVRDECPRPASTDKAIGACLTGLGELVEFTDSEITVRAAEAERVIKLPNIVFAAPLRATDGRDELVVVMRGDDAGVRSWSLVGYRFDNGKIAKSIEPTVLYQVSSSNARWIGAEVRDVDLFLDIANHGDTIEVGGLLTTRPAGGPTRDVVVISTVSRRHGKPAAEGLGSDGATPRGEGSGSGGSDRAKP